jgi:GH18 family chitinase
VKPSNLKWIAILSFGLSATACNETNLAGKAASSSSNPVLSTPDSSSTDSSSNLTSSAATGIGNHRIIGYEPSWVAARPIPYNKLTHLNYAFLEANANGSLKTTGMNLPKMQTIISDAHKAGVTVLISVGGAANTDLSLAATKARATLIANIEGFANQYGFDGIDIDWEGPANATEGAAYLALMQKLYTDLHPAGKLVTTAVGTWFGANIPNGSFAFMDFLNIMSYDGDGIDHSPYSLAQSDLTYWLGKGLPKSKAVIGVPFYGYNAAGRQTYTETQYKDIVAADASAANKDLSNGVGYNGIPTIKKKTQLAMSSASGIMIWQLSEDTTGSTSLLSAIYDTMAAQPVADSNIAPSGTGYIWAKNSSAIANTNQTASSGINDGNLATSVLLYPQGEGGAAVWEAAGVVWSTAKKITSAKFINGGDDGYGNGYFQANTKLQFSTDGTIWTDSGWAISPAYPHNSSAWNKTYSFTGTARTGVKGVRVVGQLGDSWSGSIKEVQAIGH